MRDARSSNKSVPWRMFYRVTYSERFLPPISTEAIVVPQITPVFAVPVLDPAADFLFKPHRRAGAAAGAQSAQRCRGEYRARRADRVRPRAPARSRPAGAEQGLPVLPNNVIPFDLVKSGDADRQLGRHRECQAAHAAHALGARAEHGADDARRCPGSTKLSDVTDPVRRTAVQRVSRSERPDRERAGQGRRSRCIRT